MHTRIPETLTKLFTLLAASCVALAAAEAPSKHSALPMDQILAKSKPEDWRSPDPENTLYMELPAGRVVIELAPAITPNHVANVKALVRKHYFYGLSILRSQDNYVVQWGDPNAENRETARKIQNAKRTLAPEFERNLEASIPFTPLPDSDVY